MEGFSNIGKGMMEGKNYVVTGATSGIGKAITENFFSEGARVIAVGRNKDALRALATAEKSENAIIPLEADLAHLENVQAIFDFCKQNCWKLDGVVHCAGITLNVPLRVNNIEDTERLFRINVEALAEICRIAASRRYTNEGASILAMSSTASLGGGKGIAVYSASKAAVNVLVKTAAKELIDRKIRVNAIAPAMVRTRMYDETIQELPELEESLRYSQPLGLIEPGSIADLANYLMSEKAKYITGEIIVVGAGMVI